MHRVALILIPLAALLTGCNTDAFSGQAPNPYVGAWWQCPPVKSNATGLQHGKKCAQDADCMYGKCVFGSPIAAYDKAIGICTKNNNCAAAAADPDDTSVCSTDSDGTNNFEVIFEKTKTSGNTQRSSATPGGLMKMCGLLCKSDATCTAWNPELPHCGKTNHTYKSVSLGVNGICIKSADQ